MSSSRHGEKQEEKEQEEKEQEEPDKEEPPSLANLPLYAECDIYGLGYICSQLRAPALAFAPPHSPTPCPRLGLLLT